MVHIESREITSFLRISNNIHVFFVFSYMGIGLSSNGVNLNRLPGWEKNSYGYHADDGCVFSCSGTGQQYGPTFTTGDVVGCGFNLVDRTIFFTKNGISLGTAVSDVPVSHQPLSLSLSLPYLVYIYHNGTCTMSSISSIFYTHSHTYILMYMYTCSVEPGPLPDRWPADSWRGGGSKLWGNSICL